jgi:hypothetical protein|tara:strand:+ start:460 stop:810 length:351 start_codon:yes stop_codon:yes gene_type:complete
MEDRLQINKMPSANKQNKQQVQMAVAVADNHYEMMEELLAIREQSLMNEIDDIEGYFDGRPIAEVLEEFADEGNENSIWNADGVSYDPAYDGAILAEGFYYGIVPSRIQEIIEEGW